MKQILENITITARIEKNVASTLATDTPESLEKGESFGELFDDLDYFFYRVTDGRISVENIIKQSKQFRLRLEEWDIKSEGNDPQYRFEEQERDEDDFYED